MKLTDKEKLKFYQYNLTKSVGIDSWPYLDIFRMDTVSRTMTEVNKPREWSVRIWVTALEYQVL